MSHYLKVDDLYCLERKIMHLTTISEKIMTAINDFAVAQNAFNDQMDNAIQGLGGDIQFLNETIVDLQARIGELTPEDKALLDALQARAELIAAKLAALDALTAPVVPVEPVE